MRFCSWRLFWTSTPPYPPQFPLACEGALSDTAALRSRMAVALEKADFNKVNPLRLSAELRRLTALELRLANANTERLESRRELSSLNAKFLDVRKALMRLHRASWTAASYRASQALADQIREVLFRFWPDLAAPTRRKK